MAARSITVTHLDILHKVLEAGLVRNVKVGRRGKAISVGDDGRTIDAVLQAPGNQTFVVAFWGIFMYQALDGRNVTKE